MAQAADRTKPRPAPENPWAWAWASAGLLFLLVGGIGFAVTLSAYLVVTTGLIAAVAAGLVGFYASNRSDPLPRAAYPALVGAAFAGLALLAMI
jgi:hypothetical protein